MTGGSANRSRPRPLESTLPSVLTVKGGHLVCSGGPCRCPGLVLSLATLLAGPALWHQGGDSYARRIAPGAATASAGRCRGGTGGGPGTGYGCCPNPDRIPSSTWRSLAMPLHKNPIHTPVRGVRVCSGPPFRPPSQAHGPVRRAPCECLSCNVRISGTYDLGCRRRNRQIPGQRGNTRVEQEDQRSLPQLPRGHQRMAQGGTHAIHCGLNQHAVGPETRRLRQTCRRGAIRP